MRLENEVAIITGAAKGMGASHAKRFIAEGAKVVITDVLTTEGEALAAELGPNALFLPLDVTNFAQWEEVVNKTESHFGPVTILVNNAGVDFPEVSIEDLQVAQYEKIIAINQHGTLYGMKAVVPNMKKAGHGAIVNISSLAGIIAANQKIAYTASKFAVRGMTKAAALELGVANIRVNSVHPGFIETDMTRHLISPELEQMFPLKRAGRVDEVTNLVLFLASGESSYCTGTEFIIDGGLNAQ
ncbi:SDR family NAD(P)-dependent oxidoreductase [Psychrobacillus sp. FJAT-21963]|uniref:SDR family NAD(P)-dependent oxidoreductase n=1 Tax=Psychrobacillus sp. FJAT-21963 TaxID=1712028 RepID=UPI0006F93100|nr:glucose 1-dehydrogenase [Psychrobacillus sp. FJAT-21963]KQL33714.1 3-alpha-hydroxysteroid dehydrogenase [Psychrobacillus sp. FJAT-21963]